MDTTGSRRSKTQNSMSTFVEFSYASAFGALESGDLPNAQRLFGIMAMMAPLDDRAWMGLATIRERKEQWREAAGLYGVATAFSPNSAWCHFAKARCLSRLNKTTEADAAYELALSLSQDPTLLAAIEQERGLP